MCVCVCARALLPLMWVITPSFPQGPCSRRGQKGRGWMRWCSGSEGKRGVGREDGKNGGSLGWRVGGGDEEEGGA